MLIENVRNFINNRELHTDKKMIENIVADVTDLCLNKQLFKLKLEGSHLCSFCQEQATVQQLILPCGHSAHVKCLNIIFRRDNGNCDPQKYNIFTCQQTQYCKDFQITDEWFFKCPYFKQLIDEAREQANKLMFFTFKNQENQDRGTKFNQIQNKKVKCGICHYDKSIEEIFTLDCDHKFCKTCIQKQVQSILQQQKFGEYDLVCFQCQKPISANDIQNLVGNQQAENIFEKRLTENIFTCQGVVIQNGGKFYPAGKRNQEAKPDNIDGQEIPCSIRLEIDQAKRIIKCPRCKTVFCRNGCLDPHPNQTCQDYKKGQGPAKQ